MSDDSVFSVQTARELVQGIRRGTHTAREITEEILAHIQNTNPDINAFITIDEEGALKAADAVDQKAAEGQAPGPLAGIPIALKDVLCTKGLRTTCASKILDNFIPPYDATVVTRLRQADAIILGKLNMDEFAMGSSSENSHFGAVKNPRDQTRVTGGSSGGSAAAVAAGQALMTLGSDTGGSVRLPASFCGVVGLKPTYGRVSRYGLIAYASSLDQIGPFARTVEDAATLLGVIAGHDSRDSTSAHVPVPDYLLACQRGVDGLTIGLPMEFFGEGLQSDVRNAVMQGVEILKKMARLFAKFRCQLPDIPLLQLPPIILSLRLRHRQICRVMMG